MKALTERYEGYALSVSATTRSPRPGEEDGKSYFFKSVEEFEQMIAEGVRDNGLGDGGGMLFGMNLANGLNPHNAASADTQGIAAAPVSQPPSPQPEPASLDQQLEAVKKLKELLDAGILSQEEFDAKKRQVLGL